jgi:hypothetical protein
MREHVLEYGDFLFLLVILKFGIVCLNAEGVVLCRIYISFACGGNTGR